MTPIEETPVKIAFLGTGLMGAPMARRLLAAGFQLSVWNRDNRKAEALAADGAQVMPTPAEAAAQADIVITMLTNDDAVNSVLFQQGVVEQLRPGAVIIDSSSISPPCARSHAAQLAQSGIHHIDAPVSGGVVGAQNGTLAIMAGGDKDLIERLSPIFAPLGRVVHVGPSGAGQICKLANQQIVGVTIGAVAEAMLLVEAAGASPAAFRDAIRGGFAESRILELHGKRMVERAFEPGGPSSIQLKDLNNVMALAHTLGLSLPLTQNVRQQYADFVAAGGGAKDHSALLLHLEEQNKRPAHKDA